MNKTARRKTALAAMLICVITVTLGGARSAAAETTPAPTPAATATAPKSAPPSPEALALATEIAGRYTAAVLSKATEPFDLADYPILQTAPFNAPALSGRWSVWAGIFQSAVRQTLTERRPQLESLLARTLAARLSMDELRAAARFMASPGGAYVDRVIAHEQPTPAIPDSLKTPQAPISGPALIATMNAAVAKAHRPLPPEADAALAELKQSEAGRALVKDLLSSATWTDAMSEFFTLLLPPAMIHIADGLEADQAGRDAVAGDAPSPEALALGVSIVRGAYGALDDRFWAQIQSAATSVAAQAPPAAFGASKLPPNFGSAMLTATVETIHLDQPVMEQSIGRALARLLSPEDLQVLSDFMNSPAPSYFLRRGMSGVGGSKSPPRPPPEVRAALRELSASGVMNRLASRMQDKDKDRLIAIGVDAFVPITAHLFRRFGQKLAADAPAAAGGY